MKRIAWALPLLWIASCASTPPAPTYDGPTAVLKDTVTQVAGATVAQLYFVLSIDGKEIRNAFDETYDRNRDRGPVLTAYPYQRNVPAKEAKFHLLARSYFAAPILEMTGHAYQIQGDVQFTPQAGETYVVKGELTPEHSVVWIESEKTGARVSTMLQVNGSAEVKMFKKALPVEQVPPGS